MEILVILSICGGRVKDRNTLCYQDYHCLSFDVLLKTNLEGLQGFQAELSNNFLDHEVGLNFGWINCIEGPQVVSLRMSNDSYRLRDEFS